MDDVLYVQIIQIRGKSRLQREVLQLVPKSLVTGILYVIHDTPHVSHPGEDR